LTPIPNTGYYGNGTPEFREIIWIGSSRADAHEFPEKVRKEIGTALTAAQFGRHHPSVKVLGGFKGASVREVVVDDPAGTFRVVFTVKYREAIYGLHSFQKKSKSGIKTPKEDVQRINARLAAAEEDHEARFG